MNFPKFYFYDIDCKGQGILEDIVKKCSERVFNSIIISMGNDERNIELANALLRFIRQIAYDDLDYKDHKLQLDIFVNLREDNAEKRLNWNTKLEKELHPGINVIPYGDYANMFTYANIISDEQWRKTTGIYATLSDAYNLEIDERTGQAQIVVKNTLLDIDHYGDNEPLLLQFLKDKFSVENFDYISSSYNRESSIYAHSFYPYHKACFDSYESLDNVQKQAVYTYLASVEHIRWNRFMIMRGYIYSRNTNDNQDTSIISEIMLNKGRKQYNKEVVRIHTDIVPTDEIAKSQVTFGYDYMNVLAAVFFLQK